MRKLLSANLLSSRGQFSENTIQLVSFWEVRRRRAWNSDWRLNWRQMSTIAAGKARISSIWREATRCLVRKRGYIHPVVAIVSKMCSAQIVGTFASADIELGCGGTYQIAVGIERA